MIDKKEAFADAFTLVKNAVDIPFQSFTGTPETAPSPGAAASSATGSSFTAQLRTAATSTTGGVPNWLSFFAGLFLLVGAGWYFIKKKGRGRRKRRY